MAQHNPGQLAATGDGKRPQVRPVCSLANMQACNSLRLWPQAAVSSLIYSGTYACLGLRGGPCKVDLNEIPSRGQRAAQAGRAAAGEKRPAPLHALGAIPPGPVLPVFQEPTT